MAIVPLKIMENRTVRKSQQTQIIKMLLTLQEAHIELRKNILPETAVFLLADCQDFARQIGLIINSIEGEKVQTAALLEEYCDLVYDANTDADGLVLTIQLQTHLVEIYKSVKRELKPDKIEAVFFPYQLSMWDSLESIYLAAIEDPHCEVYVVPIPWYEKRPDETLGESHYDGDRYPEYVPVTDWREYNTEERRPDIIFIHNPSDDQDYATSVHPKFYSERLWEHTELLCYCPYFVSLDDITRDFAVTTGATNSDKVFVQSEKIRAGYIREVEDFAMEVGRHDDTAGFPKKVVALGSPKYDRVIKPRLEDLSIPDEWLHFVEKPDGSRKTTVLYNTSITALLHGKEKMIETLRQVFDIFRRRDDAVLWWRPHPLSSVVLKTMLPHLTDEYKRLVEEYTQEGFGIYDDTPHLHRSLQMTDILYGDASSCAALYQCMAKPVLIHNVTDLSSSSGNNATRADRTGNDEQSTGIDIETITRAKTNSSTKAAECLFIESNDGITPEHLLDILALPEQPAWLTDLLHKQKQLKLSEIANPDGTAGAAIWEYCRTAVLR